MKINNDTQNLLGMSVWNIEKIRLEIEKDYRVVNTKNESVYHTLTKTRRFFSDKIICFICNTERSIETNYYNEGEIVRCLFNETAKILLDKNEIYLKNQNNHLFMTSKCLNGFSHYAYAADVFCHQSFYIRFIHTTLTSKWNCGFNIEKW